MRNGLKLNTESYTSAVDIWSLAMVFAERAGGLPQYHDRYRKSATAWSNAILKYFGRQFKRSNELIPFLLDNMMQIKPDLRRSASQCHHRGLQLYASLSFQHSLDESFESDSHRLLITELGCRSSSKIDSIINPTEKDDDNKRSTFKRSCVSQPDDQNARAVNVASSQRVTSILQGQLWFDDYTEPSDLDDIISTVEPQDSHDGVVPNSQNISTRIRCYIGDVLIKEINRETETSTENDSKRTFRPAPKRARIDNSSRST